MVGPRLQSLTYYLHEAYIKGLRPGLLSGRIKTKAIVLSKYATNKTLY